MSAELIRAAQHAADRLLHWADCARDDWNETGDPQALEMRQAYDHLADLLCAAIQTEQPRSLRYVG